MTRAEIVDCGPILSIFCRLKSLKSIVNTEKKEGDTP